MIKWPTAYSEGSFLKGNTDIFFDLLLPFYIGLHYFFKAELTYSERFRIFVMVRRELRIYICLQQSTFKKGQIYAKNIVIYIFRIKDTVWAYFLKNDMYTTLYFSL